MDWFGWCTWDAFYKAVNPTGIEEGLQRYTANVLHFLFHTIVYVILKRVIQYRRASSLLPLYSHHLPMMHFLFCSLREGGAPPRFLIIDDGWQETVDEFKEVDETLREQTVLVFHPLVTHKSVHCFDS